MTSDFPRGSVQDVILVLERHEELPTQFQSCKMPENRSRLRLADERTARGGHRVPRGRWMEVL